MIWSKGHKWDAFLSLGLLILSLQTRMTSRREDILIQGTEQLVVELMFAVCNAPPPPPLFFFYHSQDTPALGGLLRVSSGRENLLLGLDWVMDFSSWSFKQPLQAQVANGLQERQQVQVFISCFSRQAAGKGSAVSCEIQILCDQVRREACFAIFTDTLSFLMIHWILYFHLVWNQSYPANF